LNYGYDRPPFRDPAVNRKLRAVVVVALIVAVPLAVFHHVRIFTALMNAPLLPLGHVLHADVPYGDDPSHRLDIYVPKEGVRSPVVVFWHGGMWMRGSKDEVRFVGAALARSGYVAVIPNYRLHPQVRYPAFVEDGARAVAWVRESISQYHGDRDAIFLMGHSAGAYIATIVAFDGDFLRSRGTSTQCFRGVIGLAGPYTLERPSIFTDSIFGKPSKIAWRPVDVVSDQSPPTLLLHGRADNIVWVGEAEALANRLRAHAVPVELKTYIDRSHQDLLIAWWRPLQFRAPVRQDVQRFIESHVDVPKSRRACNS
jgi:acetyl esterase/lipase